MILSKMEIHGFKSFAHPVELHFNMGLTAVVGPNGSGKSNIADAMRWVLGEQSAKSLRGAKMEDVIFNGTELLKSQGFCSVSLTFDNTDQTLPISYNEVTVCRKFYRSGESEYSINKKICRLKDIVELFRDTGIGKEGYCIVGQGRIDEILSSKPGERRAVFEEAAGVSKYRFRKEEAERKLEKTTHNLTRLEDILFELEAQLAPLCEQSEKAKSYLLLRDQLRELELNLFLITYDKTKQRVQQFQQTTAQLTQACDSLQTRQTDLRGSQKEKTEQVRVLEEQITQIQQTLLRLTTTIEQHDGDAKVLRERTENAQKERQNAQQSAFEQSSLSGTLFLQMQQKQQQLESLAQFSQECSAQLTRVEGEVSNCDELIVAAQNKVEALKDQIYEAMNRLSGAKVQSTKLEGMKTALNQRLDTLRAQQSAQIGELEQMQAEHAEATDGKNALEIEGKELNESKDDLITRLEDTQFQKKDCERTLRDTQNTEQSLRSKINVLSDMKSQYEGYYSSVRNLLRDCAKTPSLPGIIGVVAELITVPKELESAVEMSLGGALQHVVTQDEQCAKRAINYLRDRKYGRATFLPLNVIKPRALHISPAALAQPGVLGIASKLIAFDAKHANIIENLLGSTVIVRDMDTGIALSRSANGNYKIATLQGDIINAGGSMTGGSMAKREFSLLGRERELEQLKKQHSDTQAQQAKLENTLADYERMLAAVNDDIAGIAAQHRIVEITITRQCEKIDLLDKLIGQSNAQLEKLQDEAQQIEESLLDIQLQLETAQKEQTQFEQGQTVSQADVASASEALSKLRNQRQSMADALTDQKVQLASSQKEYSAIKNELERLVREKKNAANQAQTLQERDESLLQLIQTATQEQERILESLTTLRTEFDQNKQEMAQTQAHKSALSAQMAEIAAQCEDLESKIIEMTNAVHKAQMNQSKADMELEAMQNRIWEEYELTYDGALQYKREIVLSVAQKQVSELKSGIKQLGDINISAIEDYKNVSERYEELSAQQTDLLNAKADLERLIEQLLGKIKTQFKSQFAIISENFSETFKELFGGGHAQLRLSDTTDVLESDIEIIAQPPGKNLQLLSLLSGGERALTAIALLFAMLKLRPAPFCLLDEIEAALDEANVDNFANYVKKYANKTQFIVITHRKGSMVVCDTLYGVAMEEKGVSRIVSVRMSDAMNQEVHEWDSSQN